jgi:hypothetical protein
MKSTTSNDRSHDQLLSKLNRSWWYTRYTMATYTDILLVQGVCLLILLLLLLLFLHVCSVHYEPHCCLLLLHTAQLRVRVCTTFRYDTAILLRGMCMCLLPLLTAVTAASLTAAVDTQLNSCTSAATATTALVQCSYCCFCCCCCALSLSTRSWIQSCIALTTSSEALVSRSCSMPSSGTTSLLREGCCASGGVFALSRSSSVPTVQQQAASAVYTCWCSCTAICRYALSIKE